MVDRYACHKRTNAPSRPALPTCKVKLHDEEDLSLSLSISLSPSPSSHSTLFTPAPSQQQQQQQQTHIYQSSHSSSFFFAAPAAPPGVPPPPAAAAVAEFLLPALPIADVPTALYLGPVPWRWSATDAKSSQNAFLLSSIGAAGCRLPSGPSTNRVRPSWAPLTPVCATRPTLPAAVRAWAAKSDSESCVLCCVSRSPCVDLSV